MTHADIERRTLLKAAAALAAGGLEFSQSAALAIGRAGDFDFLAGEWRIQHKRLSDTASGAWDAFEGEATVWSVLDGIGSLEELRIPARKFAGMGIRLLDVEKSVWSDYWVNARSGVLTTPGMTGSFANGVGTFVADDVDGGTPIKVRGVWDGIAPRSCRWHQAISRDGGASWQENWFMDWTRA